MKYKHLKSLALKTFETMGVDLIHKKKDTKRATYQLKDFDFSHPKFSIEVYVRAHKFSCYSIYETNLKDAWKRSIFRKYKKKGLNVEFGISVNDKNGEWIDILFEEEVNIEHKPEGYFCGLCGKKGPFFTTSEDLLSDHLQSFVRFVNIRLKEHKFIFLSISDGSTITGLTNKVENETIEGRTLYFIPIVHENNEKRTISAI